MKKDITALFCFVDDFLKVIYEYEKSHFISGNTRKPTRECGLNMSEIITIILLYYQSKMRNFEQFYKLYLPLYKDDFSTTLSYNRFIEIKKRALQYKGF